MAPGDYLHSSSDSRPLSIAIRWGNGWWDFKAGRAVPAIRPLDPTRFTTPMYVDPMFGDIGSTRLQTVIVPAAARLDLAALLVECTVTGSVVNLTDTTVWVGLAAR